MSCTEVDFHLFRWMRPLGFDNTLFSASADVPPAHVADQLIEAPSNINTCFTCENESLLFEAKFQQLLVWMKAEGGILLEDDWEKDNVIEHNDSRRKGSLRQRLQHGNVISRRGRLSEFRKKKCRAEGCVGG